MSHVIWALDTRDRIIACPAKPVTNAVILHLSEDGSLDRDAVGEFAELGVMAAAVSWPGVDGELTDDDTLGLEDAVIGLRGLAQAVAVIGTGRAEEVARNLAARVEDVAYVGRDDRREVLAALVQVAPV